MNSRLTTASITAAIVLLGGWLYLRALGHVPAYLIHDEAQGALQAHAIATTGRDLSGRLLPMYFTEPEFLPGRDPALIYVTALGLRFLPFSEAGARTPTTLVAVIDLVLMFLAATAIFRSVWAGLLAAVFLALAPVHFIRGRLLLSPLYSIPFVLAWLWSLARFAERPTMRRLVIACAWLGLGMYSYLAAVVMMPLYLLMTIGVAIPRLRWRGLVGGAAVGVCLVPMAIWYVTHPERNAQIVSAYQLDAGIIAAAGRYLHLYWSFFDPSYLFISGDASLVNSTRTAGLFPAPFAVLVPIGLVAQLRSRQPLQWVLTGGLLAAPLVSVISGAIEMNRVMFAIPFFVLAATSGVVALWEQRSVARQAIGLTLVVAVAWQFGSFYRSYVSETYRVGSAYWFSGNVREALRELIGRSGDSPIYISREIEWIHRFWRFYAIEAGRLDLIDRTTYFRDAPETAPPNAKLLCPADSPTCAALAASPAWRSVATVPSIDGNHRYIILERVPASDKAG